MNCSDALTVLASKAVEYKGHTMCISEYHEMNESTERRKSLAVDEQSDHDSPSRDVNLIKAVKVSGITKDMKSDVLLMFFENFRRSGGGDIENMDFTPGSDTAVITFKDDKGIALC